MRFRQLRLQKEILIKLDLVGVGEERRASCLLPRPSSLFMVAIGLPQPPSSASDRYEGEASGGPGTRSSQLRTRCRGQYQQGRLDEGQVVPMNVTYDRPSYSNEECVMSGRLK